MTTPTGEGLNANTITPALVFVMAETAFAQLGVTPDSEGNIEFRQGNFTFYYEQADTLGRKAIFSDWEGDTGDYCQIDAASGSRHNANSLSVLEGNKVWDYGQDNTNRDIPDFVRKLMAEMMERCVSVSRNT